MPEPTPRDLGYRMPAEWEPHAATWLAWPHEPKDWPGKFGAVPWVFAEIARHLPEAEMKGRRARVVLEGGAIDVDGQGTLLATEQCLLSGRQARNKTLGKEGTQSVLREYLGVEKVLWLGKGIAGDDTGGHVDD